MAALCVLLCGCEKWEALRCARGVCATDSGSADASTGPVQWVGGFDDESPLVGLSVGENGVVVVTEQHVTTFGLDGGSGRSALSAAGAWAAIDAIDSPTRFFLVDTGGQVKTWLESQPPATASGFTPPFTGPVLAISAYREANQQPIAAFFTSDGGSTSAFGFRPQGTVLGPSVEMCGIEAPAAAAIAAGTVGLLGGVSRQCELLGNDPAAGRYMLTFWPRDTGNPAPRALSNERAPTRLRLSSNEDQATVVFEVASGIRVAQVVGAAGPDLEALSVSLSATAGQSTRLVLDDVQQLGDPDTFVYALSNREAGELTVTPLTAGAASIAVPSGATLLIFGRWVSSLAEVTATQLLKPSRPFTRLRWAMDQHNTVAWLAASCAASASSAFDPLCPSAAGHVSLFRFEPP